MVSSSVTTKKGSFFASAAALFKAILIFDVISRMPQINTFLSVSTDFSTAEEHLCGCFY